MKRVSGVVNMKYRAFRNLSVKSSIGPIFLLMLALTLAVMTQAQSNQYEAVKGAETPQYSRSSDAGNCFVFASYVVKTDHVDADGENISVFKRAPSTNAKAACSVKGKSYLRIPDADNNSFYGLYGTYLFVDSGTSVDSRGLDVYDLVSRKTIANEGYMNDAKLVSGRFLMFDTPTDRKGPIIACPQAAKWKRQGGGVGWLQGKKLDLQTMKKTTVGTLRCYYME
jgi:hypothetical protein